MPRGWLPPGNAALGELLARAMEIKGDILGELDEKFSLGITVDDFTQPEFLRLRRYRLHQVSALIGAVAGQLSIVQFGLGTSQQQGSVLARVEKIILHNRNAALAEFAVGLGLTTISPTFGNTTFGPRDDRQGATTALPAYQAAAKNQVAAPSLVLGGASCCTACCRTKACSSRWTTSSRAALFCSCGIPKATALRAALSSGVNASCSLRKQHDRAEPAQEHRRENSVGGGHRAPP